MPNMRMAHYSDYQQPDQAPLKAHLPWNSSPVLSTWINRCKEIQTKVLNPLPS